MASAEEIKKKTTAPEMKKLLQLQRFWKKRIVLGDKDRAPYSSSTKRLRLPTFVPFFLVWSWLELLGVLTTNLSIDKHCIRHRLNDLNQVLYDGVVISNIWKNDKTKLLLN